MKKVFKKIFKLIFSRTMLAILAVLLQVLIILGVMAFFRNYAVWFLGGFILFIAFMIIRIVNEIETPEFKITWIIVVLCLPILGITMYLFVQLRIGVRFIENKLKFLRTTTKDYLKQDETIKNKLAKEEKSIYNYVNYMNDIGGFPVYQDTTAEFFSLGDDMFIDMISELKKAKKYIFLEYFIIQKGYMWNTILEILKIKVKEGVEVRVLYDGTCSFSTLPMNYNEVLEELGIKCKQYAPIRPLISTHYNNRDHRKIMIIDGKVAYTGGVNLADEYINRVVKHGHWKDTGLKVVGNAVTSFIVMFLEMWNINEKKKDMYQLYFLKHNNKKCDGYVLPYGSNPFDDDQIAKFTYLNILHDAKDYVHIITPYLIIDNEMLAALLNAAKKGIDVKMILPHLTDNEYVQMIANTYYKELIKAGVKIYEYTIGFTHAKIFISDDSIATVGTVNLDYRSLYLHFECGVFLFKHKVINDIESDFQKTLAKSEIVTLKDVKKYKWYKKIGGRVLKLFAPLM